MGVDAAAACVVDRPDLHALAQHGADFKSNPADAEQGRGQNRPLNNRPRREMVERCQLYSETEGIVDHKRSAAMLKRTYHEQSEYGYEPEYIQDEATPANRRISGLRTNAA